MYDHRSPFEIVNNGAHSRHCGKALAHELKRPFLRGNLCIKCSAKERSLVHRRPGSRICRPVLFIRRTALGGILPEELPALLLLRRQAGEVPPLPQHLPQVVELVTEPEAAVGVHGARGAHVAVVDLAEAGEARRVEEPDAHPEVAGELALDLVEDGLLVVRREPRPRRPPPPQHLDRPVRRLDVVEPGVGQAVEAAGVAVEYVARRRHVREHGDVPERVAQPHDVHVLPIMQRSSSSVQSFRHQACIVRSDRC